MLVLTDFGISAASVQVVFIHKRNPGGWRGEAGEMGGGSGSRTMPGS